MFKAAGEFSRGSVRRGICPVRGNAYLFNLLDAGINRLQVHVDDLLALAPIGRLDGFLHVFNSVSLGKYLGELEESSLQNGVGAVSETDFSGNLNCIYNIDMNTVFRNVFLGCGRQMLRQLRCAIGTVDKESAARLNILSHVVFGQVAGVVAGNEVCFGNIVRRLYPALTETQVADGNAAGFFRVILEVCLNLHIGMVADNLDGVLVRANRSVRAESPELAGDNVLRGGVRVFGDGDGKICNIVNNADSKAVYRLFGLDVAICGND